MDAPSIPDSLCELMRDVGPRWGENVEKHVRQMLEAFTPVLAQCPKEGVTVSRDLPYGKHPRQRLDVYAPDGLRNAPVVVFVHGGAFVDGSKDRTTEIYGNVLYYFARNGVFGINVEFRLAPEARYPGGAQDIGLAVDWVHKNATTYGWDPSRVFLFGHSAGGAHAGSYAYDKRFWGSPAPRVAGLIVVSGRMIADQLPENPNAKKVEAYFGTDPRLMWEGSPINHVDSASVATFVAMAEFDNPLLDVYCAELVARLANARRKAPPFMWLRGHNHTSIIAHFNTAEDRLGKAILEFIESPS